MGRYSRVTGCYNFFLILKSCSGFPLLEGSLDYLAGIVGRRASRDRVARSISSLQLPKPRVQMPSFRWRIRAGHLVEPCCMHRHVWPPPYSRQTCRSSVSMRLWLKSKSRILAQLQTLFLWTLMSQPSTRKCFKLFVAAMRDPRYVAAST